MLAERRKSKIRGLISLISFHSNWIVGIPLNARSIYISHLFSNTNANLEPNWIRFHPSFFSKHCGQQQSGNLIPSTDYAQLAESIFYIGHIHIWFSILWANPNIRIRNENYNFRFILFLVVVKYYSFVWLYLFEYIEITHYHYKNILYFGEKKYQLHCLFMVLFLSGKFFPIFFYLNV